MLKSFYQAVLPGSGAYALFLLGSKKHVWAGSIDELVEQTESRRDQQGVYFAVESFLEPTTRTQANVRSLRSLRLDIDAGDKKFAANPQGTYPTQRAALEAALAFFKASRVAPSYIVSSGEGLHIYYCLTDDLAPTAWLPLAKRLGELAAEHELRVDSSVTCDSARILRPIGALHPNGSRVRILKETGVTHNPGVLRNMLGVADEPAITRKFNTSVNNDVVAVEGPPKSAVKIAQHCPAMREVAAVKGDVPEPLWRAMLGIVKFTVEGQDLAHEWSSGYDGYNPDEVDAKYNAWAVGPTSCAEFAKHTKACDTCPHHGKIKSPVVLGYMTPDQVEALPEEKRPPAPTEARAPGKPWDGNLPIDFEVKRINGEEQMVYRMKVPREAESGDVIDVIVEVPFSKDIFWFGTWADAGDTDDVSHATLHRYDKDKREIKNYLMEQSLVADRHQLLKFLAGKSCIATSHKKADQAMNDYVRASLQRIRGIAQRPKIADRFGLRIEPNGDLISAHGKYVIYPDGRILEAMLSTPLRSMANAFPLPLPDSISGEWTAEVWPDIEARAKRHADFMKESYGAPGLEQYQLAAMLILASPLMAFVTGTYHTGVKLPGNGMTVSLYSRDSGRGKSALAQAIFAAYGDPAVLVKDQNGNSATDNARISKSSLWGTMPLSLEEMGSTKEQSIASLISSIANGAGKDRATRNGGLIAGVSFALIALATTNRAQRDMVAATQTESAAIQQRLLELNFDNQPKFSSEQQSAFTQNWSNIVRDCAGALGAVIERELCRTGVSALNRDVVLCVDKARTLLGAKQDDRFQFRALGAMLYLQVLLKKIGMDMFDTGMLVAEFKKAYANGLAYIAENILPTGGLELMQMALSDLKGSTLITETETTYKTSGRYDLPLNQRVPDQVLARHVTSMGWTYVSTAAIRDWCAAKKVSERDVLNDCKRAGVLIAPNPHRPNQFSAQLDLFKGTREENTAYCRTFKLDVRKLASLTDGDWHLVDTDNVVPITRAQEASAAPAQPKEEASA